MVFEAKQEQKRVSALPNDYRRSNQFQGQGSSLCTGTVLCNTRQTIG